MVEWPFITALFEAGDEDDMVDEDEEDVSRRNTNLIK